MMPHRFVKQSLIHRRAKHGIGQLNRADDFVIQIDNVYAGHGYLLALRTIT